MSVLGTLPTSSMRPARFPPRSPMSHNALPRQLMPRAVTETALEMMEKIVAGRILEGLVLGIRCPHERSYAKGENSNMDVCLTEQVLDRTAHSGAMTSILVLRRRGDIVS